MKKIDVVQSFEGDWQSIYIDGERFADGHRIDKEWWMDLIRELRPDIKVEYQETEDGMLSEDY